MRQQYSETVLEEIINQYSGLGKLLEVKLFVSGYENTNYYIKTDTGEYVIKIFEGKGLNIDIILFEVAVMNICYQAGCKTSHVHKTKTNKLTCLFKNKITITMDYIPGKNAYKQKVSNTIAYEIGQQAGKID